MNKRTIDLPAELTDPREFLLPQRFDLAAKHLYARLREKNVDSGWGRFVYAYHLRVWNSFTEEFPRKTCEADFLEGFHKVIEATRAAPVEGLRSLIPLTGEGIPLNGAHRIAAALLLGKMVACAKTQLDMSYADYDQRFFEKEAASTGELPDRDVFDAMALEFCRLLPHISIAVKFPAAKRRSEEVEKILSEHAVVFYRKAVTFENEGPVQLMRTLYETESWAGDYASNFDGLRRKAGWCFTRRGPVYFYLLACEKPEELLKAKERIRALFGIEKNSIHLTDAQDEALRVARLAFSNPGIRFANARSSREMPNFNRLFAQYRKALAAAPDPEDFCIEGSAVMAACGIRDCADLDYISHGDQRLDTEADCHNEYGQYYKGKTLDDIIFHHANHFYLDGVKFATLENVRDWKCARGEPKDQTDIALIEPFISRRPFPSLGTAMHLIVVYFVNAFSPAAKETIRRLLPKKTTTWLKKKLASMLER